MSYLLYIFFDRLCIFKVNAAKTEKTRITILKVTFAILRGPLPYYLDAMIDSIILNSIIDALGGVKIIFKNPTTFPSTVCFCLGASIIVPFWLSSLRLSLACPGVSLGLKNKGLRRRMSCYLIDQLVWFLHPIFLSLRVFYRQMLNEKLLPLHK